MQKKSRASNVVVIFGVLLPFGIFSCHMCYRSSAILEIGLPILAVAGFVFWTDRAKTAMEAWLRVFASIFLSFVIQMSYQFWLHSDAFPQWLLSQRAKEIQTRMEKKIQQIRLKKAEDKERAQENKDTKN